MRDAIDRPSIGGFDESSYAFEIIPGQYEVTYQVAALVDGIPHNTQVVIECVQIQ